MRSIQLAPLFDDNIGGFGIDAVGDPGLCITAEDNAFFIQTVIELISVVEAAFDEYFGKTFALQRAVEISSDTKSGIFSEIDIAVDISGDQKFAFRRDFKIGADRREIFKTPPCLLSKKFYNTVVF